VTALLAAATQPAEFLLFRDCARQLACDVLRGLDYSEGLKIKTAILDYQKLFLRNHRFSALNRNVDSN
jgi:hypothetical protein